MVESRYTPIIEYYTPAIEDIHVGMTVQIKKDNDWVYHIWNINDFNETKELRIKYLDDEDILSLGWKFHKEENDGLYNEYSFNTNYRIFYLYFRTDNIGVNCSISNTSVEYHHLRHIFHFYHGKPLNKSELNKLMVQIGITKSK